MTNLVKRQFLTLTGRTALGLATGFCSLPGMGSEFDIKKYAGNTLRINWPEHIPQFRLARTLARTFTNETGIKLDFDNSRFDEFKKKLYLASEKRANDYDLIVFPTSWKSELIQQAMLQDLDVHLSNQSVAFPNYDFQDLVRGYVDTAGVSQHGPNLGRLFAIPFGCQTSLLAYRRDIFEQHHLEAPVTYAELERLLSRVRLKIKSPVMTAALGTPEDCAYTWLLHYLPNGGQIFSTDWSSRLASEPGIKTLQFLKLIRDTNEAALATPQSQNIDNFLMGTAIVYLDSSSVLGQFRSSFPDSRILERVGYALHPRGSRYAAKSDGYGFGIPVNSANPEMGLLFAQWMTSKRSDIALVKRGGDPQRISTINDASIRKLYPEIAVLRNQLMQAIPEWQPSIPQWGNVSKLIGQAIHDGLKNNTPDHSLLKQLDLQINNMMHNYGYLKVIS